MFANTLSSLPSRDVESDNNFPAVSISERQSNICFKQFREALNLETSNGQGHRKQSAILICPQCQCQTDLEVKTQKGHKSWIIRITLMLTLVLSCFAFKPCLIDDLKQFEYKCVNCDIIVDSFRGYEFN